MPDLLAGAAGLTGAAFVTGAAGGFAADDDFTSGFAAGFGDDLDAAAFGAGVAGPAAFGAPGFTATALGGGFFDN